MSILSGVLKLNGAPVTEAELSERASATDRYATGCANYLLRRALGMCVQPYQSHTRSLLENGPTSDACGNVLGFDGRLDNFIELASQLAWSGEAPADSTLVLAGFRKWGVDCLSKLVGDWALALWCESDRTLYLARDHAGTRTLFYRHSLDRIDWATYLEFFFTETEQPKLSGTYVAANLSAQHLRDLTPYEDIHSVQPGHVVAVRNGAARIERHWLAFGGTELRYRRDEEYDEHFLELFRQAVARRTEADPSVIAELSGGMDSTSIVCMSDHLRRGQKPNAQLLDTVSYYDDEESSLDERTYFSITEAARGKQGVHLNRAYSQRTFLPHDVRNGAYLVPGADSYTITREGNIYESIWSQGYLSILSGVGGDELLGGVPDCNPELAPYFMAGKWARFIRRSMAWALAQRTPLICTARNAIRYAVQSYTGMKQNRPVPCWLNPSLRETAAARSLTLAVMTRSWAHNPRQLDNERTWWSVMESLPHCFPRMLARPEYRYPYLDRDLVEYLHRVPRTQLVQPGRRRLLMRRALRGIVPEEILERKQKAYQLRGPVVGLQQKRDLLRQLFEKSILAELGYIDAGPFLLALDRTCAGDMTLWFSIMQTIALELWLRSNHGSEREGLHPSLAAEAAATELRLCAQ